MNSSSNPTSSKWLQQMPVFVGKVPLLSLLVFFAAFLVLYLPTYVELAHTTWSTDEQGHGPLILAASAWLLWTGRDRIFGGEPAPRVGLGLALLSISVMMYAVGRSQGMIELEALSQILTLGSGLLLLHGASALGRAWFALFFLLFMIPLPGTLVQAVTLPLKAAVSVVSEQILYWAGYPVGRTGVVLTIGPYQLLVADACSGLNSLFTLESLGMLYMNLMHYQSKARNVILAAMIVPISFISNVSRVIILVLITFYFGDEAGQGFAHGFAGLVLFTVALVLTYGFDRFLAVRFDDQGGARGARSSTV